MYYQSKIILQKLIENYNRRKGDVKDPLESSVRMKNVLMQMAWNSWFKNF